MKFFETLVCTTVSALCLVTTLQAKAFEVDAEKKNDPIVIKLVGHSSKDDTFYVDEAGTSRFNFSYYVSNGTYDRGQFDRCELTLYSSAGVGLSKEISYDASKCTDLRAAMATVGKNTPVTITVNRASKSVIKVKSTTDYLSSIEDRSHLG
jgi:hypothetical protein